MSDSLQPCGLYVARQAPLSIGFSRQEYWSGLPFPSPGDLPNPGIKPRSAALQADSLPSEPPGNPSLFIQCDTIWLQKKKKEENSAMCHTVDKPREHCAK